MFSLKDESRKSPQVSKTAISSRFTSSPCGLNLLKEEDKMNEITKQILEEEMEVPDFQTEEEYEDEIQADMEIDGIFADEEA